MTDILSLELKDMPGLDFECACGRRHSVGIRHILTGNGALAGLTDILEPFGGGELFLIADSKTFRVCGERTAQLLTDRGFKFRSHIFKTEAPLVPDEKAIGRLLPELDKKVSAIIAVGSGTLNDLGRIMSCRLGIPYIIVATAPSMDGYASVVSALIVEGFKITYEAVYPYGIVADTDILKNAPPDMIKAGFGDILGKLTALADWELSRRLNGEYYCPAVAGLVRKVVAKCTESACRLLAQEEGVIGNLTDALILSGIAMGMIGNSRPASGSEHHLAHYWEMDALSAGREHPLHGNSVGAAAVAIAMMYELLADRLPAKPDIPAAACLEELLKKAGACASPAGLGIDERLFRESIQNAYKIRERYTVMRLAASKGWLEELSEALTRRFYGKRYEGTQK